MLNKKSYKKLLANYQQVKNTTLLELFAEDSSRAKTFSLESNDIYLDYSKNNITNEVLNNLFELARESNLPNQIKAMFDGKKINNTENRAVLHTLLRNSSHEVMLDGENVSKNIAHVLEKMGNLANKLHRQEHLGYTKKIITDIVNIGVGGSDLGPQLVCEALKPYRKNKLDIHFISSIDGYQFKDVLSDLNPETTLFIVASKTFTTQETITNANSAKKWFLAHTENNFEAIKKHFVACSTNAKAVAEFGIDPDNMFEFWDFVGGRYSLWSAIGLPIMLYIGEEHFSGFLAGAHAMDEHFLNTPDLQQNMPVVMALISIWYINFYNYPTQVILPYNTRLNKLSDYLQQQQMESNGKHVDMMGQELLYKTCPVIWGGSGINGQHAYFQLLHQGTQIHPMDLIVATSSEYSDPQHNDILMSNIIAQAEAFMCGKATDFAKNELRTKGITNDAAKFLAKHKTFVGNRPSNMLLLKDLSPYNLGQLIALYEHKTFVQGIIWGINSFDQWGVELGKELAKTILTNIESGAGSKHDESTANLIKRYLKVR